MNRELNILIQLVVRDGELTKSMKSVIMKCAETAEQDKNEVEKCINTLLASRKEPVTEISVEDEKNMNDLIVCLKMSIAWSL